MLSYFDLFFEKFSKKYFGFFSGNFFSSEILSLRLPFCWPLILRAIFSALSLEIHRLALVCIFAQVSSARSCSWVSPWAGRLCGCGPPPGVAGRQADDSLSAFSRRVFMCCLVFLQLVPSALPTILRRTKKKKYPCFCVVLSRLLSGVFPSVK